jgi:cysteine desulfurase/selenocysteine lyase
MMTMTAPSTASSHLPLTADEVARIRADFPVLRQQVYGKPLVYLDNAATSQKPRCVAERIAQFYLHENATVRRGVYALSEGSTAAFAAVRQQVAEFINAPSADNIVFVRGTTEAINLVSTVMGRPGVQQADHPLRLKAGDAVLVTHMEHHANFVPWQLACQNAGATFLVCPILDSGELDLDAFSRLIQTPNLKLLAVTHVSNVLGTVNPIADLVKTAHAHGVAVLVDGAQAVPHAAVDVQALDCDFYAFSAHKLYGPTGIGVLYAKAQHLNTLPPYQCGGDMIDVVTVANTTYKTGFERFEAGTPAIAQVIGLGEALRYLGTIGLDRIATTEQALLDSATTQLTQLAGIRLIGTAPHKASLVTFTLENCHPLDIGTILDHEGICIRTGHHCAQPLMQRFGVTATARASFAFYNTPDEIIALVGALKKAQKMLS